MKNIWDYISRTSTLNVNSISITADHEQNLPNVSEQIQLEYYRLKQISQQIKEEKNIMMVEDPYLKFVGKFGEIVQSVERLLGVVGQVRKEIDKNLERQNQYGKLKDLDAKHSEMVKGLQEEYLAKIEKASEEKKTMSEEYSSKILSLESVIKLKQEELHNTLIEIQEKKEQNETLKKQLSQRNDQINRLTENLNRAARRIDQFTQIQDSSIRLQAKGYNPGEKVQFENILAYSKIRKSIYSFISPLDFLTMQLTNKSIHYICNKTLKKQYIAILIRNKNEEILKIEKEIKQFERNVDEFPTQNIRTNAIKYLFFKIKPGTYILPYFQQEEDQQEKIEEKSKLSLFFFKKNQNEGRQKLLNYEAFKNDQEFEEVRKKIQMFFGNFFGVDSSCDLKFYTETMKKQSKELRASLKNNDKTMQLLCMSKFLYLQMNELNNLLQVCFALLVSERNNTKLLSKKNEDFKENDKVLRNLVENLADNREKVQKRIFYLENQNLKNRGLTESLESQIKERKETSLFQKVENQKMKGQIKKLQSALQQSNHRIRSYSDKWQQISNILSKLPLNQNLSLSC